MTLRTEDLYDRALLRLVRSAFARLHKRLLDAGPWLSARTLEWMGMLAGGARPDAYFTHPQAFPMLLLPWWLERTIRRTPNTTFQTDVAYSTIGGYYFVRMIDDLMDRDQVPPPHVLPAMILFHTEFQRTYSPYFDHDHAFWDAFSAISFASAEAASRDAGLDRIDRRRFLRVSSRKVAGAKVPLAAVCHRYGRADLLEPWSRLVDLLGCWHQMWNDMFGWAGDLDRGQNTYFLSEAARRAGRAGSIGEWIVREGLPWGAAQLDDWMGQLVTSARALGCPPLVTYLDGRRETADQVMADLERDLPALVDLAAAVDGTQVASRRRPGPVPRSSADPHRAGAPNSRGPRARGRATAARG